MASRDSKKEKREKQNEEKEENEEKEDIESGIVDGVVNQLIPGLGDIVRTLERTSPEFRKKIAETDTEIKHRIETGWSSKPVVDYGISIRPLVSLEKGPRQKTATTTIGKTKVGKKPPEMKVEVNVGEPIIDVFEEKDYISVIAELPGVPEKDIETRLTGNTLEISAGKHSKSIELPSAAGSIIEKTYRHGILQLKIERMKDGN